MLKRIHIFKSGNYGDSKARQWTNEELKQMVSNYDFGYRRAMVKIGHDGLFSDEKGAVGWVGSLEYKEDNKGRGNVYAVVDFKDEDIPKIKDRYINVSVEVVKDISVYDKETDKQGAYLLGVALLGSSQPAVPELEPVQFSKEGLEVYQTQIVFENDFNITKYSKGDNMDIEELKRKNEELQNKLQEFAQKERAGQIEQFISANADKIIPAVKGELQEFCLNLSDEQLETFKKIIDKMPKVAVFENMEGEEPKPKDSDVIDKALEDLEIFKKLKGE